MDEILWAQIFHDTVSNSSWLVDKSFSPGRWAVGYDFLYVLYRALSSFRPKKILELGLGQTTHMISQYVSANTDVKHTVVEHDLSWIKFYEKEHTILDRTEVIQMDLCDRSFMENQVTAYKDFSHRLTGGGGDVL
ncbi:hypothetical protein FACS1894216_17920 [Synergistales bacterium]|nr:hypothetical protein FACS1894216_17920 [Synergistales bacterium]